jgi:hypothetical protein
MAKMTKRLGAKRAADLALRRKNEVSARESFLPGDGVGVQVLTSSLHFYKY